jgi:hypothetical protein
MRLGSDERRRRGRPRKFAAPSRAVTLTLPVHVIDALGALDADLSRAIVRLAPSRTARPPRRPAELAVFGRSAVIVVNPTKTLEKRIGVHLVPLPDGRALLSFDRAVTTAAIELTVADALDDEALRPNDRAIFQAIAEILRTARRSKDVTLRQRSIIVLEASRKGGNGTFGPPDAPQRRGR